MTAAERLARDLARLNRIDSAMAQPEPRSRQDDPARTNPPRRSR